MSSRPGGTEDITSRGPYRGWLKGAGDHPGRCGGGVQKDGGGKEATEGAPDTI